MSSAVSKRQQARNERALQELVKTVPGNDRCADCQARNPGWASWNIGVFLCMRCGALHRKLGTHISKVKSLSMDSWTDDQLSSMKQNGNVVANKIHNPRNIKPPIPIDADEADSAMERFIRQKYEAKTLEDGKPKPPSREDPSYINKSVHDSPPPLPPKPGKKFGFSLRSSSRSEKSSPTVGADMNPESPSSSQPNKQSRTLGLNLTHGNGSFESKLAILRDMGFLDEKRNTTVLRGLDGDLDKTVETLVRLGDGTGSTSGTRTPNSRITTPGGHSASDKSTNPFDQLDAGPPGPTAGISVNPPASQNTFSNGTDQPMTGTTSTNPFDNIPARPAATSHFEHAFNNLQIYQQQPQQQPQPPQQQLQQQQQPLFPNTTGGYPSQQQGQVQFSRSQHSMTPPVTTSLNTTLVTNFSPTQGHNPFVQSGPPTANSLPSPQTQNLSPTNPYFVQTPTANFPQQQQLQQQQMNPLNNGNNPYFGQQANTMPAYSSTSPFGQPPPQQQVYQQSTGNPYATTPPASNNPFPQPQQINRMDKSGILSLYNFSQPPPTIPEQPQQQQIPQPQPQQPQPQPQPMQQFQQQPAMGINTQVPQQPASLHPQSNSAPPSATYDPSQSRNPFGAPPQNNSMGAQQPMFNPMGAPPAMNTNNTSPFPRAHMSQASIDVGGNQGGRHSPDIFASLSARHA